MRQDTTTPAEAAPPDRGSHPPQTDRADAGAREASDPPLRDPEVPEFRRPSFLTHSRILGARLMLHQRVRMVAALAMILGALFARYALGIDELPVAGLVTLAVGIATYDLVLWLLARAHLDGGFEAKQRLERLMFHAGWLDFVALTAVIWLVGGVRSPFMPFYLLHLIISSLMLSRGASIALGGLAYGMILGLILVDATGVLPPHALPGDLAPEGHLTWRAGLTLAVVYGLGIGTSLFLFLGLSEHLRRGDEALRRRARELHDLASQRRDFLRVTTHNMRSPVGAAQMLLTNLEAGLGGELNQRQLDWTRRAKRRLDGLGTFLTEMTQFAALEAGQLEKKVEAVQVSRLLDSIVDEYRDAMDERALVLSVDVEPDLPTIPGMPRLLREAVVNYVTNAIKYTPEGGRIGIGARREDDALVIEVRDAGLGIPPDRMENVFRDFGRVQSELPDGTRPEGTGLGLSITRRIVEAHGGLVGVDSVVGVGSRFRMVLPLEAPDEG